MSRTDDVINVAGHRLSPPARWRRCWRRTRTSPSARSWASNDELKGEVPLGLVVLKAGADRDRTELVAELVELVRQRIGPVASFKTATVVKRLPKTRSGKIVRGTVKKIADGVRVHGAGDDRRSGEPRGDLGGAVGDRVSARVGGWCSDLERSGRRSPVG